MKHSPTPPAKVTIMLPLAAAAIAAVATFIYALAPNDSDTLAMDSGSAVSMRPSPADGDHASLTTWPLNSPGEPLQHSDAGVNVALSPPLARTGQYTLKAALDEIAGGPRVQLIVPNELAQVTVAMPANAATPEQRLRELLSPFDFFLAYRGGDPAEIAAVWVYPRGDGAGVDAHDLRASASLRDADADITNEDPIVRAQAVELLIDQQAPGAVDQLQTALRDPADLVRLRALDMALRRGMSPDSGQLQHLMQNDTSPAVRLLALTALAADPQLSATQRQSLAVIAASDSDPYLQTQAQEVLAQLAAQAQPSTDASQAQ
jgi:hypothetical protein